VRKKAGFGIKEDLFAATDKYTAPKLRLLNRKTAAAPVFISFLKCYIIDLS
jgi:hypothetical protein